VVAQAFGAASFGAVGLDIVISATFNTNVWRPSITTTNPSATTPAY
jgi:hypothetical protein